MTDKQIIIDDVDVSGCGFIAKEDEYSLYDRVYKGQCRCSNEEMCKDHPNCFYKKALKQLKCKEKECNKLYIQLKADEEYHKEEENTLRKIIKNKEERNIELYKENNKLKQTIAKMKKSHQQLDQLKAENEKLIRKITEIFACLIKANRSGIITDTIWIGTMTTLWDDIAQTLGIEGVQVQVEEQILQKISECEVEND